MSWDSVSRSNRRIPASLRKCELRICPALTGRPFHEGGPGARELIDGIVRTIVHPTNPDSKNI